MKVFISYRRDDSSGYAGRLFDRLTAHFGAQHIFMDIDAIQPGEDFRKAIENAVGSCDVVLVMIGRQWLNAADSGGLRRLDNPKDWVRAEIASALANPKILVIPVLVRDASMPGAHELPDDLKELAWRNAIELSDNRFQYDANKLIGAIESLGNPPTKTVAITKLKIGAVQLGVAFLALAGVGLLFWLATSGILPGAGSHPPTPTNAPSATTVPATPAPTEEVAAATATESPISPAVQTVYQYFSYINNAGIDDDLQRAWDLLTTKLQCNPANQCVFDSYRDFWWKLQLRYKLYDCGSNSVAAEMIYYNRNTTPNLNKKPDYMMYELIDENGQLKLNSASVETGISAYCEFTPVTPVPLIRGVEIHKIGDAPNRTIFADVDFIDEDGNAYLLKYELVTASVSTGLRYSDEPIIASETDQKDGAIHQIRWDCVGTYTATFNIVMYDTAGNQSEKTPITFDC